MIRTRSEPTSKMKNGNSRLDFETLLLCGKKGKRKRTTMGFASQFSAT